jgi:deoxyribonuclease (pyrimidine dimer)
MTRINSAIPVRCLTDEHLLAEHREIKRLPYCLRKSLESSNSLVSRIPKEFVLGRGHVMFFLDKMQFTLKRYQQLHAECLRRNFKVTDYSDNWHDIEPKYMNDYTSTSAERSLLVERITQRLSESPKSCWHFAGRPITTEDAIDMLST